MLGTLYSFNPQTALHGRSFLFTALFRYDSHALKHTYVNNLMIFSVLTEMCTHYHNQF
jgi:hypothetical protein